MSQGTEEALAKLICNFAVNTKKVSREKQTRGYLLGRRKLLEDYWTRYQNAYGDLINHESALQDDDGERFNKVEMAYSEALGELNDGIEPIPPSVLPAPMVAGNIQNLPLHTSVLPKIILPTFDGTPQQWLTFKDMFITCVINDLSLTDVQRLHYLKSSLRGDADVLVKNIVISEDNFAIAWDMLVKRFENKRRIIRTYLRALLNLPTMTAEIPAVLRTILSGTMEAIRALKQLGRPTEQWDDWIVFVVTEKLDPAIVKDWEMSLSSPNSIPLYNDLERFLENRLQGLEAINTPTNQTALDIGVRPAAALLSRNNSSNRCPTCSGKHSLMFCSGFRKLNPLARLQTVQKERLCKNCLKSGHKYRECTSNYLCLKCKQKHHTMLHESLTLPNANSTVLSVTSNTINICGIQSDVDFANLNLTSTLLATAVIKVISATGHSLHLRALLDSGSQATFISEFAVQQLHLRRNKLRVPVTGVGGVSIGTSTGFVNVNIHSRWEPDFSVACSALVLQQLGHLLPSRYIDPKVHNDFLGLQLADSEFYRPGSIDVILGADLFSSIMYGEIKHAKASQLVAQRTHLGWVISGRLFERQPNQIGPKICASTITELSNLVQDLWKFHEQEDFKCTSQMSQDEIWCEEFFTRTTRRDEWGRYIVRYPFKNYVDLNTIAETKTKAVRIYYHQMHRLNNDSNLKGLYEEFMQEYLQLGHMEAVPEQDVNVPVCYLPHHGVLKESSETTKLRVVFNASKRYKSGVSLNDCLHIGPKLQNDLSSVILYWRTYRIGFMADIEKCFRQILVDKEDAEMQRIIWSDSNGQPSIYRLLTVTYGLSCSPYLTIKVLQTLAADECDRFPNAAQVLRESFYMDDCLHGADTVEDALSLGTELQNLLEAGGFLLRKWQSNSTEFLHSLNQMESDKCGDLNFDRTTRALGLYWFCDSDTLGYKVNVTSITTPLTKRQQLSDLARLYDPPGFLAPIVITGKIICQLLWVAGCTWDQEVPEPHSKNWLRFRNELHLVEQIKIPRWIYCMHRDKSYQLHVFSDASTYAIAAVAYLRVEKSNGEVKVSFLIAKTKVAPLKKITVPCLELNGALLAAKLVQKAMEGLRRQHIKLYCWSDSKTALSWIRSNPGSHRQYIANRVEKIQQLTAIEPWRYVPTSSNPADVASRGVYPSELQNLDIWWHGPLWLRGDMLQWPQDTAESTRAAFTVPVFHITTTQELASDFKEQMLNKYSTINTLLGVTAWCLRFIAVKLRKAHEVKPWCSAVEREAALQFWIRYVQKVNFETELFCLLQNHPIPRKSKLLALNPILDSSGILRLNGRLKNALIPTSERFPIILPKTSKLNILLIKQAHEATMHGGTQDTLNFLRRRYWLINGRSNIKSFIHQCIRCFRHSCNTTHQIMGNLPAHRCTPAPAFHHCGIDYAGPYKIRTSKGRGHHSYKGYIALFVCLSTRAIHLEVVSDMTTDTFLAALRRFFAVRGYSSDIYSDCATTFVGAKTILREHATETSKQLEAGAQLASTRGVRWHFIPPGSPNFGGIWEAGVKSMKYHLKRTIGESSLTFEEFYTVVKEVEAVLNSRPISALTDDPSDCTALTPGHFLAGRPLIRPPEHSLLDISINRLSKWKQLQQMVQNFWKRWCCEYLHELQVRCKWQRTADNLKVGDLVLVRDERAPPAQWTLGRIVEVHAGDDGLVRVVTLRTPSSVMKRAISKVVALPTEHGSTERQGGRPGVL